MANTFDLYIFFQIAILLFYFSNYIIICFTFQPVLCTNKLKYVGITMMCNKKKKE